MIDISKRVCLANFNYVDWESYELDGGLWVVGDAPLVVCEGELHGDLLTLNNVDEWCSLSDLDPALAIVAEFKNKIYGVAKDESGYRLTHAITYQNGTASFTSLK